MGRIAKIITKEELKAKLIKVASKRDKDDEWGEEFDTMRIINIVEKDLKKINFDFENVYFDVVIEDSENNLENLSNEPENEEEFEIITLDNGFTYCLGCAGGDWEHAVYFIVYIDNKNKLRGYVPTLGNTFNVKQKCAYGSEEDDEAEDAWDGETEYNLNLEEFNKDILSRISLEK